MATAVGTLLGLVGAGFTALPASAGINANTNYEFDCTTSLSPGTVAPFLVTTNLNASPDPSFPTGATFGAAGAISETLQGGFIAGFAQQGVLTPAGVGLQVSDLTLSSTDGTATGSYSYNHTFAQTAPTVVDSVAATWTGTNVLSGNFLAGDVGMGVASHGSTGFPSDGSTIVAVNPGVSATLLDPTTAPGSGTVTVYAPMTFTDAGVSTGNVYTTNGTNGGHANIGATSVSTFTVAIALSLPFGGAPGVGTSNCLETGYQDAAGTLPGPVQTGASSPGFPPQTLGGPGTLLVAASGGFVSQPGTSTKITPPAAAFVSLVDNGPVANNGNANLGVDGTKTVTLSQTPSNSPTTGCNLVGVPSNPRLTVTLSNSPTLCQATLVDAGVGPATVTFQFSATDALAVTGNTATETVNIGTPPVDEPLTQQVNAGQLVLSCNSPDVYVPGSPELTCPEFQFPTVTLNGLQQTTTGSGNTLYVSDNRGDPTVGWSLSASMVATPIGVGSNTNASCSGVIAFCDASVGAHALDVSGNGQIAAGNLGIGAITCTPHAGNLNPAATPGAGGTFASTQTICTAPATQSGGTFDVNKTYTLKIPSSVYAGNYWATVEFLVQ